MDYHLTVNGVLKAGSLNIVAIDEVNVGASTGVIDVNGGGYIAECGPG